MRNVTLLADTEFLGFPVNLVMFIEDRTLIGQQNDSSLPVMDRADSYSPDVGFKTLNNANLYETYILSMAMSNCLIYWDDADINLQVIVF